MSVVSEQGKEAIVAVLGTGLAVIAFPGGTRPVPTMPT
jgi:hypothetical protein